MASSAGAASRSASGSSSNDCEGEEAEEPSSHSSELQRVSDTLERLDMKNDCLPQDAEDELELFRQQWQRELEGTPTPQPEPQHKPAPVPEPPASLSDEELAKQLFLRGAEMEYGGKMYEAIQHYKRAMHILPDVEARLYESSEPRTDTPVEEIEQEVERPIDSENESDDDDAVEGEDLLARLLRITARKGVLCEPEHPTKSTHLSCLPYEVMLLIVRWVVSAELDALSLERLAAVSRGLYVLARDHDIWRSLCLRTWGVECGPPRSLGAVDWRALYVQRPRLQLNGCYISKTTYLRHGEDSFQDQFYRPWYIIEYYRYLRFFPEGVVLMWTTADEPAACLPHLKYRSARPAIGIMAGQYRLIADKVTIVIKKTNEKKPAQATSTRFRNRRKETQDQHEQTFHLELQLRDVKSRRNFQLVWRHYAVCLRRDQWTQFDLTATQFPAFAFSRVRNYTDEAYAPLQP